MNEMQARCDDVQAQLAVANQGTSYLLSRAEGLRAQRLVPRACIPGLRLPVFVADTDQ